MGSAFAILMIIGAGVVLILTLQQRSAKMRGNPSGPIFRDDDRFWYAGMFYHNADDPDFLVPKRHGIGWTFNFAHPGGKVLIVILILILLLPLVAPVVIPGLSSIGCHPSACNLP